MAFKQFTILSTTDTDLNKVQHNIAQTTFPIIKNTRLDSRIIEDQLLQAGINTINHTLGRPLKGYSIVSASGPTIIWDDQINNQIPNLTLILYSSDDCTINLEVF